MTDDTARLDSPDERPHRVGSDVPFYLALGTIGGFYVLMILGLILADVAYIAMGDVERDVPAAQWTSDHPVLAAFVRNPIVRALQMPAIRYSIWLSLITCTITTILSLLVAVPVGYLLSRHRFVGQNLLDAILDVPIVLPPLVVGLSLLILFQFAPVWLARRSSMRSRR